MLSIKLRICLLIFIAIELRRGYDPSNHVMSDTECRAKSGSFFLPYAGILNQKLCLCAKDEKVEKVPLGPF
ncbi:hypothetical protein HNY73_015233 [Argiope bruennichi]|uniref:Uncharacterized protein n=1 Tax=Argiope bruennichi TaxID=94029 RepID=A0A8T0EWV2_ARGBR|nr:hypothetical protein HNY73_015233 [Argiope bruennichi]